ncbi:MAG: DUF2330 domain-containing protein [Deltaproteobacteria bacterium]|nr:DUF2330 domain-containing protein [Deltaproteobacteria bacterium]
MPHQPPFMPDPKALRHKAVVGLLAGSTVLAPSAASAFCGFFVAAADAQLFNNASQVVIVHDEGNTVLTMVNNYRGEPRSFALVVPVPVILEKEMVRVTDIKAVDHLDAFSAPRLAEYFDPDPCARNEYRAKRKSAAAPSAVMEADEAPRDRASLGVTVEATYTVGEYDIVILSAKQSDGLEVWLRQEKYNIPAGASRALNPYVKSGMKFFVAKVNLEEQAKAGFKTLRPLQFAYPDERFMLPVRLGMLNADGDQDILAYVITPEYRAETVNYKNPKLPTDLDVPTFIKQDFKRFYRDLFTKQVRNESGKAVFTEYAWNMSWCDPCASEPLSADELEKLGVWWLRPQRAERTRTPAPTSLQQLKVATLNRIKALRETNADLAQRLLAQYAESATTDDLRALTRIYDEAEADAASAPPPPPPGPVRAFVTRLHARYNANTFPEDLMLKVTKDNTNFQARYVMRHPFLSGESCEATEGYLKSVGERQEREIDNLVTLTGWSRPDIQPKMQQLPGKKAPADPTWRNKIKNLFRE